jgi:hypothetical protein
MTDFLEEIHAQAGLVALRANPNLVAPNGFVFDGVVASPTPDPPYVLVYSRVMWPRDGIGTALSAQQVTVTTTYTCHCVGLSAGAARAVQGQVRSTLLNFRPAIAGRNCSPIKQDESLDPDRDESTGDLVMDAISTFSFSSTG